MWCYVLFECHCTLQYVVFIYSLSCHEPKSCLRYGTDLGQTQAITRALLQRGECLTDSPVLLGMAQRLIVNDQKPKRRPSIPLSQLSEKPRINFYQVSRARIPYSPTPFTVWWHVSLWHAVTIRHPGMGEKMLFRSGWRGSLREGGNSLSTRQIVKASLHYTMLHGSTAMVLCNGLWSTTTLVRLPIHLCKD